MLAPLLFNPWAYYTMKNAAFLRHQYVKEILERDPRPLRETWHQSMLDLFYPL